MDHELLKQETKYEVGTRLIPFLLEVTDKYDGCEGCYYKYKNCQDLNCDGVIYVKTSNI